MKKSSLKSEKRSKTSPKVDKIKAWTNIPFPEKCERVVAYIIKLGISNGFR